MITSFGTATSSKRDLKVTVEKIFLMYFVWGGGGVSKVFKNEKKYIDFTMISFIFICLFFK